MRRDSAPELPVLRCAHPRHGKRRRLLGDVHAAGFCDHCAAPFPWVSRTGRLYELMNLLDEEHVDPATELEVREQLEALAQLDADDPEAKRRWEKVRRGAPGLWERSGGRAILETVVSAAIKSGLGL